MSRYTPPNIAAKGLQAHLESLDIDYAEWADLYSLHRRYKAINKTVMGILLRRDSPIPPVTINKWLKQQIAEDKAR